MADNPRGYNRDTVTGRFTRVDTSNTALSADSRFEVMRELEIQTQPGTYAYDLTGRDENNADPRYDAPRVEDNLGVGGSPLRARRPTMVSDADADHTVYGVHGAVLRSAAGDSGQDDPTSYLVGRDQRGTVAAGVVEHG